jgi:4-amino-4-deoxy-L-arabinose transferase-like glycosyltransferase
VAQEEPLTPARRHRWRLIALAVVLVVSFAIKLPHLGHRALKPLDESFHAIVAANFLKHPFTPTLADGPHLDVPLQDWQNSHIWLHKPPMAMWQIALSYALLGVNTFALRLPSALLATAAAGLTFLIGKELIDETAGIVAAALQAFNPVITMLVHGYVFSDHVDISLLFWTETGIYFLVRATRTRKSSDLIICGIAQGLALASKSYPALIVSALAVVVTLVRRLRHRELGLLLLAAFLTIFPWVAMCMIRWPEQFSHENFHALRHLTQDVEGWAGPWDRVLFDYWISIFHVYYPLVIVATIVVAIRCVRLKDWRLLFLLAWGLGVLVPHLIATSKTMTATLIGWPAMWLMVGYLVSQALHGCGMSAGAWAAAILLPLMLVKSDDIPASGWGYPQSSLALKYQWVIWYMLIALAAGVSVALLRRRWLRAALVYVASISMFLAGFRWWGAGTSRGYVILAWRVVQIAKDQPDFATIGAFAKKLPADAVFMVEEQEKLENKLIQFAAGRTCYGVQKGAWPAMGEKLIDAGALPYLISADSNPDLPLVFVDQQTGRTIYACTPKAKAAAEKVHE